MPVAAPGTQNACFSPGGRLVSIAPLGFCHAAHGGQILFPMRTPGSSPIRNSLGSKLRDLGEYRLKDMTRPQRLYELAPEGQRAPAPVSAESA